MSISGRRRNEITIETTSADATRAVGARLGLLLGAGDCVALFGELASGKTVLTKGIAEALGVDPREVASPTYVLHAAYEGRLTLHHVDAYRMKSAAEFDDLGIADYLEAGGVAVIEWADRVVEAVPARRLEVTMEHAGEDRRRMTFRAAGGFEADLSGLDAC